MLTEREAKTNMKDMLGWSDDKANMSWKELVDAPNTVKDFNGPCGEIRIKFHVDPSKDWGVDNGVEIELSDKNGVHLEDPATTKQRINTYSEERIATFVKKCIGQGVPGLNEQTV